MQLKYFLHTLVLAFSWILQNPAWVDEELLDILPKNKTITQEQYDSLKKRAVKQKSLKKGLIFESPESNFEFRLGGRLMLDAAFYADDEQDLSNDTKLRCARIFIAGKIYQDWAFKGQYDFAENSVSVKDAWLGYKGLESTFIQIGNFKEPFSLEELTSSKYITFMERALPNAFAPGRSIGIGAITHGKNWTFAAGGFGEGVGDEREEEDEGFGSWRTTLWSTRIDRQAMTILKYFKCAPRSIFKISRQKR